MAYRDIRMIHSSQFLKRKNFNISSSVSEDM